MPPILFKLQLNGAPGRSTRLGIAPFMPELPLPGYSRLYISGITKDSSGVALGNCTVDLFRTIDDVLQQRTTSDGGGNYALDPVNNGNGPYYIVAYKVGAPDVAGTTVNTLLGV